MKRFFPIALVVISLLSMTLFFVEQSKAIHAASKTTLTIYEHDTTTKYYGDKNNKNSVYETVYTNPVYDVSDKIRIGSSDGICFYVSQSVEQCDWTIVLPAGKIVLSSADKVQDVTVTDAVVGGTGAYNAAKGEAVLNYIQGPKGNEFKYTFNLV